MLDEKHKGIQDTMNQICNNSGNYRHYRGLILNVLTTGGVCVPHLGSSFFSLFIIIY